MSKNMYITHINTIQYIKQNKNTWVAASASPNYWGRRLSQLLGPEVVGVLAVGGHHGVGLQEGGVEGGAPEPG